MTLESVDAIRLCPSVEERKAHAKRRLKSAINQIWVIFAQRMADEISAKRAKQRVKYWSNEVDRWAGELGMLIELGKRDE